MSLFRITKKLACALNIELPTAPIEVEKPEHEWFVLFFVQRKTRQRAQLRRA